MPTVDVKTLLTDINRFANDDVHEVGIEYDISTDGLFQVHWSNGNLRYEWEYKDGKRVDGISKGWWPNGKLKQTINWKNGKWNGLVTYWYSNGQKEQEVSYKDGKINGKVIDWYDDGVKKLEHIYKDGNYQLYYTEGECIKRNDRLERKSGRAV